MKWLISFLRQLFSKKVIETTEPQISSPTTIDVSTLIEKVDTPIEQQKADQDTLEDDGDDVTEIVNSLSSELKQYPNLCVCLDPGHGSDTPGKCSPYVAHKVEPALYFREYEFSREITNRLKPILEKHGIEVFVTVPETKDVSLTTRYKRANNKKASNSSKKYIFISIHANAAGNGRQWMNGRGWSVWTTKGQNYSDKLATCLFEEAEAILKPLGQRTRKDMGDGDPDYESNFTVIYGANMPAVLTENMFQDNIEEVKFLNSEEGKQAIVEIHRRGILKFADKVLGM